MANRPGKNKKVAKVAKAKPAAKATKAKKAAKAKPSAKAKPPAKAAKAKLPAKAAKPAKGTTVAGGSNGGARITSRHFGSIAAEMEITIPRRGGEPLLVDVNLADPSAFTQAAVDALDRAVDAIEQREVAARQAFAAAMDDDKAQPLAFWRFHHDEVEGHEDLDQDTFAAILKLDRVGFYPDAAFGSESYVVLDFAVPGPPTDQLLVAKFLPDGTLREIAWES